MATLDEMYDEVPGDETTETVEENPPAGYKPLSQQKRMQWNNFVRYLNKDKKVGGSKELDDKTAATGLKYLEEYRKDHPDFTLTKDEIPYVQYEFQQLKNTGGLPGVQPEGRVKTLVDQYFNDREVSPVDGWIGSLTSRQGYPEVTEFSDDPEKRYWGLDYEGATKYEHNQWDRKKGNVQQ